MSKSNKEFIEKYVDDSKFLTFAELEELLEKFKEYHGTDSVPGGEWLQLTNHLGQKLIMDEEIYEHFGEDDMLFLIKKDLQPLFDEFSHKEDKSPRFGHAFAPIQNILSRSAKLGFTSIYKYMTDNVDLMHYDIDGLDLHTAIKYHNEGVLDILIEKTDERYGKKGSFTHRIRPETKALEELHTLSTEMKVKLSNHFKWLDIQTISGNISLDTKVSKWKMKTDNELKDLIDELKGKITNDEFDALKGIYRDRLKKQLKILERELELEEAKRG